MNKLALVFAIVAVLSVTELTTSCHSRFVQRVIVPQAQVIEFVEVPHLQVINLGRTQQVVIQEQFRVQNVVVRQVRGRGILRTLN